MRQQQLKVAIDAHHAGRRATGNETYVRELVKALAGRDDVETVPLTNAGVTLDSSLVHGRLGARGNVRRLLFELRTPRRRWGVDLLHVQYVRPPFCDVPVVTTVHDISFEHHPDIFGRRARARMRTTIPWSLRHSAAVITGSHYTRDDLVETYGLPPDQIHVTPYAASPRFTRLGPDVARMAVDGLRIPEEFILCVGNLQPRKNLSRLLLAYASLRAEGIDLPLVVVGQKAWLYEEIFDVVRRNGLQDSVVFTGFVTDDQLVALYNLARVFVYPSLFEGFGLPVLEAFACGAPTLTSTTSSLPEVAGNAALLVDPYRVDEIAGGLARLLTDASQRDRLTVDGPLRAAEFSWSRCADETVRAYESAF